MYVYFPKTRTRGLAVVLVVRRSADVPTVRLQGLQTTRLVFLRVERSDVRSGLRHVLAAGSNSSSDRREACTLCLLVSSDGSAAFVGVSGLDVETLAVGIGGCGGTVGHDDVVTVVVPVLFLRFLDCSGDGFDTTRADN